MTESNFNQIGHIKELLTAVVVKTPYEEVEGLVAALGAREHDVRRDARDEIERRLVPYLLQAFTAHDDTAVDRLLQSVWTATYRLRSVKGDADVQMLNFFQQNDTVFDQLRVKAGHVPRAFERAFGYIADAWMGTASEGTADLALALVYRCYESHGDTQNNGSYVNRMINAQFLRACKMKGRQARISGALKYLARLGCEEAMPDLRSILLNAYVRAGIRHITAMSPVLLHMEGATPEEIDELLSRSAVIVCRRSAVARLKEEIQAKMPQFTFDVSARDRNWHVTARLQFWRQSDISLEQQEREIGAQCERFVREVGLWLDANGHNDKYLKVSINVQREEHGPYEKRADRLVGAYGS